MKVPRLCVERLLSRNYGMHQDILLILTNGLIDPVSQILLQREQLPGLRVQDLLAVEVLVFRDWRLRGQRAVSSLEATAHFPVTEN